MKNTIANAIILVVNWIWSFFKDVFETYVEITRMMLAGAVTWIIRVSFTQEPTEDETIGVITAVSLVMIALSVLWAPAVIGFSIGWNIAKYTDMAYSALSSDSTSKPILLLNRPTV